MKIFTLFFVLCVLPAGSASAWSLEGHEVVAIIAERHLTPRAEKEVRAILASEGYQSMEQVAGWADGVKALKVPKQPSHSVKLRPDYAPYNAETDCSKSGCAITVIDASMETLRDRKSPIVAKAMALKYLVHFVGDIHQPLHTTSGVDGQKVTIGDKNTSLHKLWDGVLIGSQKGSLEKLADQIEAKGSSDMPPTLSPIDWALEGRAIVRDRILVDELAKIVPQRIKLNDKYARDNWPIARDQLKFAGLRLAAVLNSIF